LLDTRLLVLDDLGREHPRDRSDMATALMEVIDQHRNSERRTIITTNLGWGDFQAHYGNERLLSRLVQSGDWFSDSGADLRRRG
jgi:DNA replication protein DnaC